MIKSFGLLILRLSIGTMLIHHGYEKLADIENFADAFVRPIGLPFPIFSSYIAAYSEIYGSWLLIAGLFTRLGALAIIGTITVAIYHAIVTTFTTTNRVLSIPRDSSNPLLTAASVSK